MNQKILVNFYGPTQSGKTQLLSLISALVPFPITQDDVTSLEELQEGTIFFGSEEMITGDNIINFRLANH